jgi:hypothetical protein
LTLPDPTADWLVDIATRRFGAVDPDLYRPIAELTQEAAQLAIINHQVPPSTAEFLDAVSACRELHVRPVLTDPTWQAIYRATLAKGRQGSAGI